MGRDNSVWFLPKKNFTIFFFFECKTAPICLPAAPYIGDSQSHAPTCVGAAVHGVEKVPDSEKVSASDFCPGNKILLVMSGFVFLPLSNSCC